MLLLCCFMLFIVLVFTPLFTISLFHRRRMARNIVFVVYTVAMLVAATFINITLPQIGHDSEVIKNKLTNMSVLDLCSDTYSRADLAGYRD